MKCDQCLKPTKHGWEYDDRYCSAECAQKALDLEHLHDELSSEDCDFEALLDMDFDGSEF